MFDTYWYIFKQVFLLRFVCKPFTFLEVIHRRHLLTQSVRSFDLFDANCNPSPSEQYWLTVYTHYLKWLLDVVYSPAAGILVNAHLTIVEGILQTFLYIPISEILDFKLVYQGVDV